MAEEEITKKREEETEGSEGPGKESGDKKEEINESREVKDVSVEKKDDMDSHDEEDDTDDGKKKDDMDSHDDEDDIDDDEKKDDMDSHDDEDDIDDDEKKDDMDSHDDEDDIDDDEDDEDDDEEDDEVKIIEDESDEIGYSVKQKPELDEETKHFMKVRAERKKKEPRFLRQEWHRYKRLGKKWRKPTGLHSKLRRNKNYRPALVRVGYGSPCKVRGLHPSGFREVMVFNPSDLEKLDPATEAARVGGSVGKRKLENIYNEADSRSIRILNRKKIDTGREE